MHTFTINEDPVHHLLDDSWLDHVGCDISKFSPYILFLSVADIICTATAIADVGDVSK
jgi:hypothetical protein